MFYGDLASLQFHNSYIGLLFHAGLTCATGAPSSNGVISHKRDTYFLQSNPASRNAKGKCVCVNGQEMHILPQAWRDICCLKTTVKTDIASYIAEKSIHDYAGLRNSYSKKKQTPWYCGCYGCAYGSLVPKTGGHCGQRHGDQRDKSTVIFILILRKCFFHI